MKRTQIYLTDEEDRILTREARRTGRSKAALVREAIDRVFGTPDRRGQEEWKRVLDRTFGAWQDMDQEEFDRLGRLRHGWSERQRGLLADR